MLKNYEQIVLLLNTDQVQCTATGLDGREPTVKSLYCEKTQIYNKKHVMSNMWRR